MPKLSLMDALFLAIESDRAPLHVAGLYLCTLPKSANSTTFFRELKEVLTDDRDLRHPYCSKLKLAPFNTLASLHWEKDHEIDMDYHVRHSALPKPGRYRELFELVSRLHSVPLDNSRPLWETHLIEGLQNRQFAIYFKSHHCLFDGVGSMHTNRITYITDSDAKLTVSPYSQRSADDYYSRLEKLEDSESGSSRTDVLAVIDAVKEQLGSTVNIANAFRKYVEVWVGKNRTLAVPMHHTSRTLLNSKISSARRFVAQSWPFERIRSIGRAFDGTFNDALLAVCSGALRRYLIEHHDLPAHSLRAMTPVSLRSPTDTSLGNAVSFITANLGTSERDPEKRVRIIQDSMAAAKDQLRGMSGKEIEIYATLTQAPGFIFKLAGLSNVIPTFNTVISNVPGMREPRYINRARLDGLYPVSAVYDGLAMNITSITSHENMDIGILACRRSIPKLQRMIDYIDEAIVELEHVAGIASS